MITRKTRDIDDYIAGFPEETRAILQEIRMEVKKVVPEAEETISYAMPCFTFGGTYLVYFAGYKKHIGFYPAPVGVEEFKAQLSAFKTGKGSVQFPLDNPMPLGLIKSIVQFRQKDILSRKRGKVDKVK